MRKFVLIAALTIMVVAGGGWLYSRSDAMLGLVAAYQGEHETAIQLYTRAILSGDLSPQYLSIVYRYRADAYAALGDRNHAIEDYDTGIRLNSTDAETFYKRATLYHKSGKHERAVADYSAAIDINPGYGEAFRSRGLSYDELGKAGQAREDFEKAGALIPDDPVVKEKLGADARPARSR